MAIDRCAQRSLAGTQCVRFGAHSQHEFDPEQSSAAIEAINWALAMEVSRLKLRVAELEGEIARRAWSVQ